MVRSNRRKRGYANEGRKERNGEEKQSWSGGVGLSGDLGSVQIEARVRSNGNKRRIVHLNIKFDAAA